LAWGSNAVKLWNLASGKERDLFTSTANDVRTAAISADGNLVAVGLDKTVKVYEVASGQDRLLPFQIGRLTSVAMSQDGKLVAAGGATLAGGGKSAGDVHIWNLAAGKERPQPTAPHAIHGMMLSPDGQTLAMSSAVFETGKLVGETRLWDVAN